MGEGGLRWNLLEKYGLIGIRAPAVPPSRYTGSGKESALWRAVEQEAAEWKAIVIEQQKVIIGLREEVAKRLCPRKPMSTERKAYKQRWIREQVAAGICPDCGKPRDSKSSSKNQCSVCTFKRKQRYRLAAQLGIARKNP